MTQLGWPGAPSDRHGTGRQLAWASVPVLSCSLLAFVPFLRLAVVRRRSRDWLVFWAYLGAVVLEMVVLADIGLGGAVTVAILVTAVAVIHVLVEFDPSRAAATSLRKLPPPAMPTATPAEATPAEATPAEATPAEATPALAESTTGPAGTAAAKPLPPGWYRDPAAQHGYRWWTGSAWSVYVRRAEMPNDESLPNAGPGGTVGEELAHLHYVEQFLDRARSGGAITGATYRILIGHVAARQASLVRSASAAPTASAAGVLVLPEPEVSSAPVAVPARPLVPAEPPSTVPAARPISARPLAPQPPRPVPAPRPGPVRRWRRAVLQSMRSDLAVHGLAYLGVLLLFAGLFGLVAFSFSSVSRDLRPVAELVVPVAVLGSAWLLARRGLATPARALELLGGLLIPVAAIASLVDGAAIPPDQTGISLVVALTAVPAAVSLAYAGWWRWHRLTPLRQLVAPALWLAVAMAALGFRDPIPTGEGIVTPKPAQFAAVLAAMTLTVAVPRLRPARAFGAALFPAAFAGLGIAALLEGLAAGVAGWPAVPVAVSGAAIVLALELCDQQIPNAVRVVLQSTVVVLTALGLTPGIGAGWAAAAAAVAGLMVLERGLQRAASGPALLAPAVVAVAGTAVAVTTPWALLTASALGAIWAHARRLWPGAWPFPLVLLVIAAAILPAGVLGGLVDALPGGQGAAAAGLAVLAAAVLARILGRRGDRFWVWWVPAAALAVAATTVGQPAATGFVVAAGAAAAALGLSAAPTALRVWLTGVVATWAGLRLFEASGVAFSVQIAAVAGAGLAAVAVAAWRQEAAAGHAGVLGHLVGLASWPAAAYTAGSVEAAVPAAVLGLAATGLVITTVAQEAGHASVPDLLVRCGRLLASGLSDRGRARVEAVLRHVPAAAGAVLLPAFAAELLGLTGFSLLDAWLPVGLTALALAYVLLARPLLRWHRVARVLADAGAWGTVLAAAACEYRNPALAALAGTMVAPVVQVPELRRRVTGWVAWAASVPFAVLAASLVGLPLPRWYEAALGWGAMLLLGGLAADEVRAGPRRPGQTVRIRSLVAPVVVGILASAAGLAGSAGESPRTVGWMLISGAAVLVVAGLMLRMGLLGGVAALMALAGFSMVLPWSLGDRPWLLLIAAAVLLIVAQLTLPRAGRAASPWLRWDIALFVVAHAAALVSVGLAVSVGSAVPETTAGCGALAIAVALRMRRWQWAMAGTVLILAGAADGGPGWASLAFAGLSIACTVLAARSGGRRRLPLQLAGALAAVAAWAAWLVWQDVAAGLAVEVSSLAGGALALLSATAIRVTSVAREWAQVWGGTALALVVASAAASAWPQIPVGAELFVAAGLAAGALGCGLAAAPMRAALLRECAAAGAIAAGLMWAYGMSASLDALTWGAVVAGLVSSASTLTPWLRRRAVAWVRPALVFSIAATGVALGAGSAALPARYLLIPALVLVGVLAVSLAVGFRQPVLAALTPIPLCAAWLAYASETQTDQPQWLTAPLGAAILAVAVLLRSARRAEKRPVATPDVISLEVTGMGLVVGASLVESVTRNPLHALIGVGLGLAIAGWGALTRVRRRLFGGMAAVFASLLLLIVVPLVPVVSHWGGVLVWLVLAGAGLIAIIAAALLDTTRAAIRRGMTRLTGLTRDWE